MKKIISFLIIIVLSVGIVCTAHNIFDNNIDGHYVINNSIMPAHLILVNAWNEINEDYEFETVTLNNGEIINEIIYPDLQNMFNDARNLGIDPVVTSGYRTMDKQQQLYDDKVNTYLNEGYSRRKPRKKQTNGLRYRDIASIIPDLQLILMLVRVQVKKFING